MLFVAVVSVVFVVKVFLNHTFSFVIIYFSYSILISFLSYGSHLFWSPYIKFTQPILKKYLYKCVVSYASFLSFFSVRNAFLLISTQEAIILDKTLSILSIISIKNELNNFFIFTILNFCNNIGICLNLYSVCDPL